MTSDKPKKQPNLFSFFSKVTKPVEKEPGNIAPTPLAAPAAVSSTQPASKPEDTRPLAELGDRIEVYWPDDDAYYAAKVVKVRNGHHCFLHYDDGNQEWCDLAQQTFRAAPKHAKKSKVNKKQQDRSNISDSQEKSEEESDEEFEFQDSDGSVYEEAEGNDDPDSDDEELVVTDDEDDDDMEQDERPVKSKKKIPKMSSMRLTVREPPADAQQYSKTPSKTTNLTHLAHTPKTVTPAWSSTSGSMNSPMPIQTCTPTHSSCSPSASPSPSMFERNALNAPGTHLHNHLRFVQEPKDSQNRARDHPDYDPRTLRVDEREWEKLNGAKMTDAVKQWWDLKSRYNDCVILMKTGKFYELYHGDADIGVNACGLLYMKGHVAHCGFPEIAYGKMADKLVRAGYKVLRVEQTETPEMLKERKKKHRGKDAPKVVNREVCSIMTLGTRTFCFLDDVESLANDPSHPSVGPLLAIKEVVFPVSDDSSEAPRAVCEYGVTIVDGVNAVITVGQFQDDLLRSRMDTLLTTFRPSEILLEGGAEGASEMLRSLVASAQKSVLQGSTIEIVRPVESFPKSTALDATVRRQLERPTTQIRPWDKVETMSELHRRKYYPSSSKQDSESHSATRWPAVLRAAVDGGADLILSSFGAVLFYLQRNLIDDEILSMGLVKAYVPPPSSGTPPEPTGRLHTLAEQQAVANAVLPDTYEDNDPHILSFDHQEQALPDSFPEPTHMALDGQTLQHLEILHNSVDQKASGSLWSFLNHTKTPHGSRMLRAWLLRPLFRKADIDRRADAVDELVFGPAASTLGDVQKLLSKCNDIERLLARIHSMGGSDDSVQAGTQVGVHPNERAVLYENSTYTQRKVSDFSKVLQSLSHAAQIPELFDGVDVSSGLLKKVVRHVNHGGCFPDISDPLDWFFDNFDCDKAAKGKFEPSRGIDASYDEACDAVERIRAELQQYRDDMCAHALQPASVARASWVYANTKPESKDKYTIELPANVVVPDDFIMKGKRGSGNKQVNKYRTRTVDDLVCQLEKAHEIQAERKSRGMQLIFRKFDSMRSLWASVAQATALLDALTSLAFVSSKVGYCRPMILDRNLPHVQIRGGRHPVVEATLKGSEFVANDIDLDSENSRVLLLSGCNMGGKSTLLRTTSLVAILAQIGCFVPASSCTISPFDRIYTRLGASDRLLLGQSTFFVELAETAAALRGATNRSLVIMDELGRGTSTFDGTAIASATVKHLVERSCCLALFATHYHSLLEEWKDTKHVRLGHMECLVENGQVTNRQTFDSTTDTNITFLYTLGEGPCPRSFGINVAKLAGLPDEVLMKASAISTAFEEKMNSTRVASSCARTAVQERANITNHISTGAWSALLERWNDLQMTD